jgi:phosphate acetyltransferase
MFPAIDEIRQRASSFSRRIVYSNPQDERVFEAIGAISRQGIAHPVLIGDKPRIEAQLRGGGLSPVDIEIVDPDSGRADVYVDVLLDDLRAKGFQQSELRRRLKDPTEYAAAMVRAGDAHGLVAGPGLAEGRRGLEEAVGLGVGLGARCRCFLVAFSERDPRNAFLIADGIAMAAPGPFELAEIALEACRCSRELFQFEAQVGFLAPSVVASLEQRNRFESAADVLEGRVKQAIDTLRAREASLEVDHQLHKEIPYNGTANIYVLADRHPGNHQYSLENAFKGARVVGPILRGFDTPANELGMGCSVEDVFDVSAITVLS